MKKAKLARKSNANENAFVGPTSYKNSVIEKMFKHYFTESHPFYLMDTLANVVPLLDTWANNLDKAREEGKKTIDGLTSLDPKTKEELKKRIDEATSSEDIKSVVDGAIVTDKELKAKGKNTGNKKLVLRPKGSLAATGTDSVDMLGAIVLLTVIGGLSVTLRRRNA